MFGRYSKQMTEWSNHLVDWSRVGELVKSGTHRYSQHELLQRSAIIAAATSGALVGWYFNDPRKTHHNSATVALACGLLGFGISHTIVLMPLIYKRLQMQHDCEQLRHEIDHVVLNLLLQEKDYVSVVRVLDHITSLSLSTDQHGHASMTLGRRKALLGKVLEKLNDEETPEDFWQREPDEIVLDLTQADNKPSLQIN